MPAKIPARFTNADAARKHLEALLWRDGRNCPHCGVVNESTLLKGQSTRPGVYWCNACQAPFSVTVGTIYERSKVPLNTWLYATHLLCSSKKGISSHQLSRMLSVTYKTAWFMTHRIREAMKPAGDDAGPLGGSGKIVEADETYIGKSDAKGPKRAGAGGYGHKRAILSLVERGGKIRSFKIGSASRDAIGPAIRANVHPESTLHTDGSQVYRGLAITEGHESVDHSKTYVRDGKSGKVHTNTLEGFFSVFKRGMVGTYQHCGEQHLDRYLAEFDFRANNRIALGCDDAVRTDRALEGIVGKRLMYRRTSDCGHVQEASMFPGQIEVMDGAEHIVPSGIWPEIFDGDLIVGGKPLYLFEHSLVLAGSKIVKAFPDREIGIRGIGKPVSGSKCAGEQIETATDAVNYGSSSRVLDGIKGADFREAIKLFAGLRIGVYSDGVWLTERPSVDAFRQNWDLGFGPIDSRNCI